MKKIIISLAAALVSASAVYADSDRLVILHTNDTHSQLDPTDKNLGGVLRRKVLIDSIRSSTPNVMLVDAGDAVQGTMYFNLFGGKAEAEMMNLLGYDLAILGNHEFDNGMLPLAANVAASNAIWLATNYDLEDSALAGMFRPYSIRRFGDKKIGFIALNLDPAGMIADGNYDGVIYNDVIDSANAMADYLRTRHGVDMVVALTHIGYRDMPGPDDYELANSSHNIDVIIGGHSHTRLAPDDHAATHVVNADGRHVLVVQTGKSGLALGQVEIDLETLEPAYSLITVDDRLDSRINPADAAVLEPYRQVVDSVMKIPVARSARELDNNGPALLNYLSDFICERGRQLAPDVDLALLNKGSIRRSLPQGTVTRGTVITMQPFTNHIVVLDIKGHDLRQAFDVMATRSGDGVSDGVRVLFNPMKSVCNDIVINGKPLDDDATYRVATIDYLANGGDYMTPLTNGRIVAVSDDIVYEDLLRYLADKGADYVIDASDELRMKPGVVHGDAHKDMDYRLRDPKL